MNRAAPLARVAVDLLLFYDICMIISALLLWHKTQLEFMTLGSGKL